MTGRGRVGEIQGMWTIAPWIGISIESEMKCAWNLLYIGNAVWWF